MKTARLVDSVRGKGAVTAARSDAEFGSDFVTRRRKLMAKATILRVLSKFGRLSMGKILSNTSLQALPAAEAIADLAADGLITMRRYPEIGCNIPLVDLMPCVKALERVRAIIAATAGPNSVRGDVRAYDNIQQRMDVLETANDKSAAH